jgi:DNA-binding HxlR family transcriptional regulator
MQKKARATTDDRVPAPAAKFQTCPLLVSMGVLGKKWTLLILRDIALLRINRFNQIRRSIPGLTSRVLVMRLHELETCGLIEAIIVKESPRVVEWALTEKGKDTIPILMSIMHFGIKWYAEEVFGDDKQHTMSELFPEMENPR